MGSMSTETDIKAQVLFGPKDLRLVTRTITPPGPSEVQILLKSTTICGSDVHYFVHYANGDIKIKEPLSQGHEAAGLVVAVGDEVANSASPLAVGDRVALEAGVPCDKCEHCLEGTYHLCEKIKFRSSAAVFPHYQGTLQERLNHPAKWCWKLPDNITYDDGALLEPLSVAIHAYRKAGLTNPSKSSILVLGAGAVGLLCAAVAKAEGCQRIVMADIAQNRLDFALEHGFATATYLIKPRRGLDTDEALRFAKEDAAKLIESGETESLKGPFHTTFECTGVESGVRTCIYSTRRGGKVLLVGMGTPIQTLPISAAALREVDLIGVWRYNHTYPKALEIMQTVADGSNPALPDIRKIITHRFPGLESLPEAFAMAGRSRDDGGNLVVKTVLHH